MDADSINAQFVLYLHHRNTEIKGLGHNVNDSKCKCFVLFVAYQVG